MNIAYLATGSNLGDRQQNLATALAMINDQCGAVAKASSLYETAAWGRTDQPVFFNQVFEVHTNMHARQLMRRLLKIEKTMGRIREEKYGPRIIDIDILFFNDEKHNYHLLKLPHPEIPNRRFVLQPLAEIAPGLVHPVVKKTIQQLLDECQDKLEVKRVNSQ